MHLTTSQAIAAAAATRLDFSREGIEFDVGQEFDSSTDVFTAKSAGFYSLTCNGTFPTSTAGVYTVMQLRVNGANVQEGGGVSGAAYWQVPNVATLVRLKVADQVDCAVYTTSAVTASAGTFATVFTVAKH